jgi:hypothetical protein
MDGGAESIKHFHFLKDIFTASGPNDKKFAALITEGKNVLKHTEKLGN